MRRVLQYWVYIASFLFMIICIPFILIYLTPNAPQQEVKKARQALHIAEKVKSKQYAKSSFIKAKKYYDSALLEWAHQNNTFFLKRNFSKVKQLAQKSYKASCQATKLAESNSKDIRHFLRSQIDSLDQFILKYDELIRSLPLSAEARKTFQNAKISFSESKMAYHSNADLPLAMKKINIAEDKFSFVKEATNALLKDYSTNFSLWKKLASSAIETSRDDSITVILVDKYAKKLYLYINGIRKYTFDVELGINWIGNKMRRNDQCTPEGNYRIIDKVTSNKTLYYKALLLNYPNKEDTIRFYANKRAGRIPASANIGDMIEIHGEGGKGINWTDGCIALRNYEMDTIFEYVSENTPVTIVGSLTKLSDIIDF